MKQGPRILSLRDIESKSSVEREGDSVRIRFEIIGKGMGVGAKLSAHDASKIGSALLDSANGIFMDR